MPPTAVIDTNVIVSGLGWGGTPRSVLDAAIRGDFLAVVSPLLLEELLRVLTVKLGWEADRAAGAATDVLDFAHMVVPPRIVVPRLADPKDHHVIAAAVAAEADFIVTGDRHLLELGSYEGLRIMTPAEFLDRLPDS